jgi:hypothetical protein
MRPQNDAAERRSRLCEKQKQRANNFLVFLTQPEGKGKQTEPRFADCYSPFASVIRRIVAGPLQTIMFVGQTGT